MGGTAGIESGLAAPVFLFDENITGVGKALRWVWANRIRLVEEEAGLGRSADDLTDIIPWCAARRATLFSFDRGFVQRADYLEAIRQAQISVVLVQQPRRPRKPRTHQEILWMVARALVLLDRGAAKLEPLMTISAAGLPKPFLPRGAPVDRRRREPDRGP